MHIVHIYIYFHREKYHLIGPEQFMSFPKTSIKYGVLSDDIPCINLIMCHNLLSWLWSSIIWTHIKVGCCKKKLNYLVG